jgi:hypothetical protein
LDRSGAIWRDFYNLAKDDLDVRQVNPQNCQFVFKSKNASATFSAKNFAVACEFPKNNLTAFEELCGFITKCISERLEPSVFSRVGYRVTLNHLFADKQSAESAYLKLRLAEDSKDTLSLGGSILGLKGGKPISGSMSLRAETEEIGRLLQIRTEERTYEVNMPAFGLEPKSYLSNVLVVDIDSYTKKPTGAGGFDAVAFVRGHHKELMQLSNSLLEKAGL